MKIRFLKLFAFSIILQGLLESCNGKSSQVADKTDSVSSNTLLSKFSKKEIYRELLSRKSLQDKSADTIPPNEELQKFSNKDLYDVIYCKDDRINLFETKDQKLIADAQKTACILSKDQLQKNDDGSYSIKPVAIFKTRYKLCDDELFGDEPICSFCSGFAISEDLFVTAGHCIDPVKFKDKVIVYGYEVNRKGLVNLRIAPSDVYQIKEVFEREYSNGTNNDYCIVKPDHSFSPNRIAQIRRSGKLESNDPLHVIGYPIGLPLKIALNGKVFNNSFENRFLTDLDTYKGNSGSPVFNSNTHIVEGILVSGNQDFSGISIGQDCQRSFVCPCDIGTCEGEGVSRVSQFWKWLK